MEARTAVILDHQPLWLDAFTNLLEGVGVEVAAAVTTAEQAVAQVGEHQPGLFVLSLDTLTTKSDAWDCLRAVRAMCAGTRAVVVSADDDPRTIETAFAEGATAFCAKSAEPDDLAAAVRQSFDRSIHLASVRAPLSAAVPATTHNGDKPDLTRREMEILQLVSEGHSNSQLAKMLWVTEQTIKFHLSNIYRKLNVANRTEASRWAMVHGLLPTADQTQSAA